jgi:hypothetical protein
VIVQKVVGDDGDDFLIDDYDGVVEAMDNYLA